MSESHISESIIFGPVRSRRFGRSLGVDLSPKRKQCNFDCVYCELKGAKPMEAMSEVVSVAEVVSAVREALGQYDFDVLTLTANGEPTLYPHLCELISTLRDALPDSVKILLLTNASLLWKSDVREALAPLDMVKFSCDSLNLSAFKKVDRPHKSLELGRIREGIARFCAEFGGEKIAEVLFVKGLNDTPSHAREVADFLSRLELTRVDIGTIDRPPAYKAEALGYEELGALAEIFGEFEALRGKISLPSRHAQPQSNLAHYDEGALLGFIARRPLSREDAHILLDTPTLALLEALCQKGAIKLQSMGKEEFYTLA